MKQYLKEGLALRTETTINDAYDFDLGRRIDNLTSVRARGEAINAALLEHEANAETARLEGPELTELVRPTSVDGRRIAALRYGDPRVMALLAAVVMFSHLPAGFSNAQLRRYVAALLSVPLEEYTSARMTYDLGRLVGHGLIARIAKSHRYRLTPDGLRQCAFLTKLADRVLDPGLARARAPRARASRARASRARASRARASRAHAPHPRPAPALAPRLSRPRPAPAPPCWPETRSWHRPAWTPPTSCLDRQDPTATTQRSSPSCA